MKNLTKPMNWSAMLLILAFFACESQFEQEAPLLDETLSIESRPTLIPDKYIVVLKETTLNFRKTDKYEDVQAGMRILSTDLAARHGVSPSKVERVFGNLITGFSAELTTEQVRLLGDDPKVDYIEQDVYAYGADVVQKNATWGLDRVDQRELPLSTTYSYNSPGADVTAYIFDSGIRYDHEHFEGRAEPGIDFYGGNGSDVFGHGTHVAGTVGGKTYGMAKKVKLVSVKVLGDDNRGSYSFILAGLDWVIANKTGPSVINMSIQGEGILLSVSQAIDRAFDNGIISVIAAGNYNRNACWQVLAGTPQAIAVGATGVSPENIDGRAPYSNHGTCIDIFAPGSLITSSTVTSSNSYDEYFGTSMAAPHVTGAAVLYLSKNQSATAQEVTDYLMANATQGIVTDSKSTNNNLLYVGKSKKEK